MVHRRFPDESARFLKSRFCFFMRLWKHRLWVCFALVGLSALLAGGGCHRRGDTPPQALAPEKVAPTLDAAFKNARPEDQQAAHEVVSALQSKDDPKAFVQLQSLTTRPDLTADQRAAATRSMLSVLAQLQAAAANGNKAAEDLLQAYRASK